MGYLPKAPGNKEKYLFLESGRFSLYIVSLLTTVLLLFGMGLFVRVSPFFLPYTLFFIITSFYLLASYFVGLFGRDFDNDKHTALVLKWFDRSARQDLDIYLPVCREPIEVIRNTWFRLSSLLVAHEGKINVYVLDDGKDPQVETLARVYGFNYIARETNELKKAGNLRNAFKQTTGEFFVVIDADFCLRKDFLLETLPYMYEDDLVGIVQTPQFFVGSDDQTLVQSGAGAIQELFYRLIQTSRQTFDGAICVGTNAIYRRSHLEPFGGTAAIGYSEDVRTGFQLISSGKKVVYIPIILAMGTCPETFKHFFTQMYRWSMGSISLMLTRQFWTASITIMQRICYLTGMGYYLTTAMVPVFTFMPTIYLLIFRPEYIHWFNIFWSVPSLVLNNIYLRYWQKTGYPFSAIECRSVSYYAHLFALVDCIFGTEEEWVPTGAVNKKQGNYERYRKYARAHIIVLYAIVIILCGYQYLSGVPIINFVPLFILMTYNLLTLRSVFHRE